MLYQLFSKEPPIELLEKVIGLFGIKLEQLDGITITTSQIVKLDIINKFADMKDEFAKYYIKCKYKQHVENMNNKKVITILRHLLKVHNYKITWYEKKNDNLYKITKNKEPDESSFTLSFN